MQDLSNRFQRVARKNKIRMFRPRNFEEKFRVFCFYDSAFTADEDGQLFRRDEFAEINRAR